MARASAPGQRRAQGNIETLKSGALRVRVFAGYDPVTRRRHYEMQTIPAGPKAWREAERVRARLIAEVAERRTPRTNATLDQLLEKYLEQFDGAPTTLALYRGHVERHISPLLGRIKVGTLDVEALDSFYAELRRCRKHCRGRADVDHRTHRPHECDERCRKHVCKPLARSTVRHMHFILSGAYEKAVRWRWVATSPIKMTDPPAASPTNPQPPTPDEAARILNEAWRDPDWGSLLWTAMTTGVRRGELCAIRWSAVNLDEGRESIWLRHAIRRENGVLVEAGLKTHQQRRIALDLETVAVLREQLERARNRSVSLGMELESDAFVFTGAPDGSTFLVPDSVTQRYERLVRKLGIHTTIHKLRHYSATELIAAGVDVSTVAGRLGHSGGGVTTLRTYAAWVSEADQRAAGGISARMPSRPEELTALERARIDPRSPYEVVAADLADQVRQGALPPGDLVPAAEDLAAQYGVAVSTARRAVGLLVQWELALRVGSGRARLSREADREVLDLERRLEPRLGPHADLAHMTDWASKLNGAIARLAGLLFLADVLPTAWGEPVPARHIDAAARLGHYFLGHALAVFDQMGSDPTVDDAHHVLDWILRTGRTEFTRREAFSALSRLRFRKVADLDPALQTLAEHGFLRRVETRMGTQAGRPASPRWEVHPASAESAQSAES